MFSNWFVSKQFLKFLNLRFCCNAHFLCLLLFCHCCQYLLNTVFLLFESKFNLTIIIPLDSPFNLISFFCFILWIMISLIHCLRYQFLWQYPLKCLHKYILPLCRLKSNLYPCSVFFSFSYILVSHNYTETHISKEKANLLIPNTDRPKESVLFCDISIMSISIDDIFSEIKLVVLSSLSDSKQFRILFYGFSEGYIIHQFEKSFYNIISCVFC